jgi:hypothetical protein
MNHWNNSIRWSWENGTLQYVTEHFNGIYSSCSCLCLFHYWYHPYNDILYFSLNTVFAENCHHHFTFYISISHRYFLLYFSFVQCMIQLLQCFYFWNCPWTTWWIATNHTSGMWTTVWETLFYIIIYTSSSSSYIIK